MPYPFLIWAAAFFVIPAMGLAMGMLWAASMIGLVFVVTYVVLQTLKMFAQQVPVVRDLLPDEVPAEELSARRLAAEATAERVAAEIEAEIQAVAEAQVLLPASPADAADMMEEAKMALMAARQQLQTVEAEAKQQSGGWMAVCDARERVHRAEVDLAKVESVARPMLPSGESLSKEPATAEKSGTLEVPQTARSNSQRLAVQMSHRSFSSAATPLRTHHPAGFAGATRSASIFADVLPRAAMVLRKAMRR